MVPHIPYGVPLAYSQPYQDMDDKYQLIYLADDDPDHREIFNRALEELPFQVKFAAFDNGVDLMADLLSADTHLPDVIFLDLNMPLMNGEECLEDIRDEHRFCKIPVVIYSTFFDMDQVDLLRKEGADRYIQKPKSFPELRSLLHRAIASTSKTFPIDLDKTDFVIKAWILDPYGACQSATISCPSFVFPMQFS